MKGGQIHSGGVAGDQEQVPEEGASDLSCV